jgi:ATP-binding cassette subfamily C (CFTR/MRP) protein 4
VAQLTVQVEPKTLTPPGAFLLKFVAECLTEWTTKIKRVQKKPKKTKKPKKPYSPQQSRRGLSSPVGTTNIISLLSYHWVGKLLWRGYKYEITEDDIWEVPKKEAAEYNDRRFQEIWEKISVRKKPSMMWAFFKLVGGEFWIGAFATLVFVAFSVLGPAFFIKQFVFFLQEISTRNPADGWMYVIGLFLQSIVQTTASHYLFYSSIRCAIRAKAALMMQVYRKSLKVGALHTTIGEILNMQSNDSYRLHDFFRFFHFLWATPLLCIVVAILLIFEVGVVAAIVGLVVLILLLPLQLALGKKISSERQKTIRITDFRVRLMNEILNAIKVVKLYCWERSFSEQVSLIN